MRYGAVTAVDRLSFEVRSQDVVVILGANAAGKTSTLRAICGLTRLCHGSVMFSGADISGWKPYAIARKGLALVPEGRRIFANLSVEENLLMGAYMASQADSKTRLAEVYALFPILGERRRGRGGLLSGGEQQMLAIGRALMSDPKLVLLDEPSEGLSPRIIRDVMDQVVAIAQRGVGVLMVEQNAAVALEIATRALVVERGRLIVDGSPQEVAANPEVGRVFLGLGGQ